jgi:hypothetical protein
MELAQFSGVSILSLNGSGVSQELSDLKKHGNAP